MEVKRAKIILGIDPGTIVMGYGVIKTLGKELTLIQMGVVKLNTKSEHSLRLKVIFEKTRGLIDSYLPDELAIEAPFYGRNVQSMLKLGRAQGVAMAAALTREVPITEYAPKKIKQAITGNGNASKESVARMLGSILQIKEEPEMLDATDGLAAAVCHHFQLLSPISSTKSKGGWEKFLKQNLGRIK